MWVFVIDLVNSYIPVDVALYFGTNLAPICREGDTEAVRNYV